MSTTTTTTVDELKSAVLDRLVKSGEYTRMSQLLDNKLRNCGWYDEINELVTDQLSQAEKPNFEAVSKRIQVQALDMVPQDIKQELLTEIKEYLDNSVEKV